MNTAASANNAAAIQSLDDRVTAELASKLDSSALAPAIAPLATAATTDRARKQHRSAVVATKSTPDGVDLKLSNYSTTAAMNGSIASANNATLATITANYGRKTVVDQHSLDIAARITPLEVDTKVANALLGAVTAAALPASKTDASALTAYVLQSAVFLGQPSWTLSPRLPWTPPSARRTQALASLLSTVDGLRAAAVAALSPPPPVLADRRAAAIEALVPLSPVLAEGRAAALATSSPPPPVLAEGRAAALATLAPLSPVRALLRRPAHRCHR